MRLRPLQPVKLLVGPHKGTAGKVQKVQFVDDDEEAGKVAGYVVEQDVDNKLVAYKPAELELLK